MPIRTAQVSIIIPTKNRPDMLNRCLDQLHKLHLAHVQIIVVDSSTISATKETLSKYPETLYFSLPNGKNNRHIAKNMGLKHADGDIVAFLDDDSIIQDCWLEACVKSYASEDIGGAGGIIIDTNAPQEVYGSNDIGRITFNGTRIGNFDKDPGKTIEVDHLRGCNMSFRKDILCKIGGFDLNYTGSNVLEETDLSIRVRKAGYKIIFNPKMAVIHTSAPREVILREAFTLCREFYIARNSTYFMLVNFGLIRTLAYILTNDTGIMAFLKKPTLNSFLCIWVFCLGKVLGFIVGTKVIIGRAIIKK